MRTLGDNIKGMALSVKPQNKRIETEKLVVYGQLLSLQLLWLQLLLQYSGGLDGYA